MARAFAVNTTIGFLRTAGPRLFLPPEGRDLSIGWRQARRARIVVTVETRAGEIVRTLARRRFAAGEQKVVWNGLGRDRKAARGGRYLVRLVARNELGRAELVRPFAVQRIAVRRK